MAAGWLGSVYHRVCDSVFDLDSTPIQAESPTFTSPGGAGDTGSRTGAICAGGAFRDTLQAAHLPGCRADDHRIYRFIFVINLYFF